MRWRAPARGHRAPGAVRAVRAVAAHRAELRSSEDRLAAVHEQLVTAVEALASSEAWAAMLRVAARFPTYSPSNVLLIGMQRPDATKVAGFGTWKAVGRHVRKGEHGIAILAPCVYRADARLDGVATSKTADEGGAASEPRGPVAPVSPEPEAPGDRAVHRRELRGFKVVYVFDVSQTDGDPLPDVAPARLNGAAPAGLWDHLVELAHEDGYRLERGPCGLGANGYTDFTARVVRIRDDVDPAQAVKTLAHELGHIRADHEHRFTDYDTSAACRGQAEVEAESIAYLITAQAGLDSATYSVPYLASWSGGDVDLLRESMTRVVTVARTASRDNDIRAGMCSPAPETCPLGMHPVPDSVRTASAHEAPVSIA